MCGPCARCCSSACRRGRSQQGCEEESAGEGATGCCELMRGRCVRMACVEGVTRDQRAAVMPGEPSLIELFVPLTPISAAQNRSTFLGFPEKLTGTGRP